MSLSKTFQKSDQNKNTTADAPVHLLVRAETTEEAAESAFVLLSINHAGVDNLRRLAEAFETCSELCRRNLISAVFYEPIGIDTYLITDDDCETLENLLVGTAADEEADAEFSGWQSFPLGESFGNLRRIELPGDFAFDSLSSRAPDFTVEVTEIKFYADASDFYLRFPYKHCAGEYWIDSLNLDALALLVETAQSVAQGGQSNG